MDAKRTMRREREEVERAPASLLAALTRVATRGKTQRKGVGEGRRGTKHKTLSRGRSHTKQRPITTNVTRARERGEQGKDIAAQRKEKIRGATKHNTHTHTTNEAPWGGGTVRTEKYRMGTQNGGRRHKERERCTHAHAHANRKRIRRRKGEGREKSMIGFEK